MEKSRKVLGGHVTRLRMDEGNVKVVKGKSPATQCQLCQIYMKSRTNMLTLPLITNMNVRVSSTSDQNFVLDQCQSWPNKCVYPIGLGKEDFQRSVRLL
jgi:hypothetical protein